jgi:hypothetical protein
MEEDVDDIAKRFDLYPNFVVDTGARVDDLMVQRREKVRAFLIRYQDRVLYGSDAALIPQGNDPTEGAIKNWEDQYAHEWKYLATSDIVMCRGRKVQVWRYRNWSCGSSITITRCGGCRACAGT